MHIIFEFLPSLSPDSKLVCCPLHAEDQPGAEIIFDPASPGRIVGFDCRGTDCAFARLRRQSLAKLWRCLSERLAVSWFDRPGYREDLIAELDDAARKVRWPKHIRSLSDYKLPARRDEIRELPSVRLWQIFGGESLKAVRVIKRHAYEYVLATLRRAELEVRPDRINREHDRIYATFVPQDWVVMQPPKSRVLYVHTRTFEQATTDTFNNLFSELTPVRHDGTFMPASEAHAEQDVIGRIDDVVCWPNSVWAEKPKIIKINNKMVLNEWRGIPFPPRPELSPEEKIKLQKECSLFINHINNLMDSQEDAAWVLTFLSGVLRYFDTKPQFALIHLGSKGAGKGTLYSIYMRILGEIAATSCTVAQACGAWGDFLAHSRFVLLPEADNANPRTTAMLLRDIVAPDSLHKTQNMKYGSIQSVLDNNAFVMTANSEGPFEVTDDERRYLVVRSFNPRTNRADIEKLKSWCEKKENMINLSTLLFHLAPPLKFMFEPPPKTPGLRRMMALSASNDSSRLELMITAAKAGTSDPDNPFRRKAGTIRQVYADYKRLHPRSLLKEKDLEDYIKDSSYFDYRPKIQIAGKTLRRVWMLDRVSPEKALSIIINE